LRKLLRRLRQPQHVPGAAGGSAQAYGEVTVRLAASGAVVDDDLLGSGRAEDPAGDGRRDGGSEHGWFLSDSGSRKGPEESGFLAGGGPKAASLWAAN
jgi:hypothetical protein